MDKLNMQTKSKVDVNVDTIGELFPNTVTEVIKGYNEKNEPIIEKAIDFDILKQELSKFIVEGREERYQMNWPGKKEAILKANASINKTLRPCRKESVNFDKTENLYIEGDNSDVLKLLQETYLNKVKMIYIDPPYNTGNDSFVYPDNYSMTDEEFREASEQYDEDGNIKYDIRKNNESNGRFHTDWLNMMYPRLKLARDLLREDGVIFISIDDNEAENLKKIGNEIFGEENLVAMIPWQARQSIQNDTDLSSSHEYIVSYAKNRRIENRRLKENNQGIWNTLKSFSCYPLPLEKEKFSNPDNDIRGLWKADPFDAPNVRPNLTYAITNINTGEVFWPPKGRCWRTDEKSYKKLLNDNRIIFGKNGVSKPQLKVFYEEKKKFGSVDNTWFSGEKCGTATQGTKELQQLFDGISYFDTPKPIKLISKLMKLSLREKSDDIILDFFSGSSTTAHAVMQLNAEDGGNRKFIMVQIPEETDERSDAYKAGYKNICEIGKERIRRAGKKIKEENPESARNLDIGFRVLKLDSSNMKDVYYKPKELKQSLLDYLENNIKEDRTSEDLLFQVMLDLGEFLSSDIEEIEIEGKKVFNVGHEYIVACFDDNVTDEVVEKIAKMMPVYAVFRDSSLQNDSLANNVEQILKTYSPNTRKKVL